jgi:hypothetical protein
MVCSDFMHPLQHLCRRTQRRERTVHRRKKKLQVEEQMGEIEILNHAKESRKYFHQVNVEWKG